MPELEREWWKAEGARTSIYVSLFPWFGPALIETDWPSDSADVQAIMRRADREWTAGTRLSPLTSVAAWKRAMIVARDQSCLLSVSECTWESLSWSRLESAVTVWSHVFGGECAKALGEHIGAEARRELDLMRGGAIGL